MQLENAEKEGTCLWKLFINNFYQNVRVSEHLRKLFGLPPTLTNESENKWWPRLEAVLTRPSHLVTISKPIRGELLFFRMALIDIHERKEADSRIGLK